MAPKSDKSGDKTVDAGLADLEKRREAEQDAGYIGQKVDPRPNSDYSLESGPDSPSLRDVTVDAAEARLEDLKASNA